MILIASYNSSLEPNIQTTFCMVLHKSKITQIPYSTEKNKSDSQSTSGKIKTQKYQTK